MGKLVTDADALKKESIKLLIGSAIVIAVGFYWRPSVEDQLLVYLDKMIRFGGGAGILAALLDLASHMGKDSSNSNKKR